MDARVVWYDQNRRGSTDMRDIDPTQLVSMERGETFTDGQWLSFKTTEWLPAGARIAYRVNDVYREFVVTETESVYGGGKYIHSYHAPWSLQVDLQKRYMLSYYGNDTAERPANNYISNIVSDTPWELSGQSPGTVVTPAQGAQFIGHEDAWSSMLKVLKTSYMAGADTVAKWLSVRFTFGDSTPSPTRRFVRIHAEPLGTPTHWLEVGANVKSMRRATPQELLVSRLYVMTKDDQFIPNGSDWASGTTDTNSGLGEYRTYSSGGFVNRDSQGAVQTDAYDLAQVTASRKLELMMWAQRLASSAKASFPIEYRVELEPGQSMALGDFCTVYAPGLPEWNAAKGSTTAAGIVSGMVRNELTGTETYTVGMSADVQAPFIRRRKDYS